MNLRFFQLTAFLFLLTACNYNHLKQSEPVSDAGRPQFQTALDFRTIQEVILRPRCLGCHMDATGNQGGANLETYSNVRRLMNRISFRSIEKMDMPPRGPLSSTELQLLKNWLEMGAPEKSSDIQGESDSGLDLGPTDWEKINKKIFARKCLDCHSQPSPQGDLDLNSYEQVKSKAMAIFDRVILKQDMPVEPYPALSMRERKILLDWMNMGLPQ